MSSSVLGCPVGGGGGNKPAQSPSTSTIVLGDTMKGSHVVTIDGYSRLKGLGNDGFFNSGGFLEAYFNSGHFHIGGHTWFLTYSSDGHGIAKPDYISLYLRLAQYRVDTRNRIHISCSLLDHDGQIVPSHTWEIDDITSSCIKGRPVWGIERKVLEESPYLIDDRFRVRCDIIVESNVRTQAEELIAVPPSDMHQHIGHLLSWQEGVDVTFEVDGETFSAHRLVLAARSSVFKAQLFGPMKEKTSSHIQVDGMEASVFKAMLHFIYNDVLPDIDREDMPAMAQHLLVAADRYGLERLKAICENKLWYNISKSTLATTLAIAEQHGCRALKEACFDFLMKSTRNLEAVLDGDGFQHLLRIFPLSRRNWLKNIFIAHVFSNIVTFVAFL